MGFRIQVQALSSEWQILNIDILYIFKAARFLWPVGFVNLAILAHLDAHTEAGPNLHCMAFPPTNHTLLMIPLQTLKTTVLPVSVK